MKADICRFYVHVVVMVVPFFFYSPCKYRVAMPRLAPVGFLLYEKRTMAFEMEKMTTEKISFDQ